MTTPEWFYERWISDSPRHRQAASAGGFISIYNHLSMPNQAAAAVYVVTESVTPVVYDMADQTRKSIRLNRSGGHEYRAVPRRRQCTGYCGVGTRMGSQPMLHIHHARHTYK